MSTCWIDKSIRTCSLLHQGGHSDWKVKCHFHVSVCNKEKGEKVAPLLWNRILLTPQIPSQMILLAGRFSSFSPDEIHSLFKLPYYFLPLFPLSTLFWHELELFLRLMVLHCFLWTVSISGSCLPYPLVP